MNTSMPTPAETADRARDVLDAILADVEFGAFEAATLEYSSDWQRFVAAFFPCLTFSQLDRRGSRIGSLQLGGQLIARRASLSGSRPREGECGTADEAHRVMSGTK
ncbi:hypothetical protein ACTVZO_42735 [Streptomyces sp. IBSNAI002]|uniref:hypothetical protein n=1 Tax=Streptomyces sp. IBSNAI002 TaxID=3457500 RepID=UPI003FD0A966